MQQENNKFWDYYINPKNNKEEIEGKYLFFSKNKDELKKIAINEIENEEFPKAKINTDNNKKGEEYVLCLYYKNTSRKDELLEKYKENKEIRFKGWKSNEDTRKGKYSHKFLNLLSKKEKKL